jgi:hypothetical protein
MDFLFTIKDELGEKLYFNFTNLLNFNLNLVLYDLKRVKTHLFLFSSLIFFEKLIALQVRKPKKLSLPERFWKNLTKLL